MMMTWVDEIKAEGREEGLKKGLEKGQYKGMQELVVRLLTQRFGPLPARIKRRITATRSVQKLQSLADQVLRIRSLQELAFE